MKYLVKFLVTLFLSLSFFSHSQNIDSIEYHLANYINNYRLEKKLNALKFDSSLYNSSKKHLNYLSTENKQIDLHFEYNKDNEYYSGENYHIRCGCTEITARLNKDLIFIKINPSRNDKKTAEHIFKRWKNSPGHNKAMLNKDLKYFGPSILIGKSLYANVNFR